MREDYCQACGKRVGDRECAHGILCKKCDKEVHGVVNASCELERKSEMRDRIGREDREGPYENPERVPEVEKPVVKLTGADGNIFAILGACTKALKKSGQKEAAEGLFYRVTHAGSYDEALRICMEYVDVQ